MRATYASKRCLVLFDNGWLMGGTNETYEFLLLWPVASCQMPDARCQMPDASLASWLAPRVARQKIAPRPLRARTEG